MSQVSALNKVPSFQFDRGQSSAPLAEDMDTLRIDIEGYEGPLDLLIWRGGKKLILFAFRFWRWQINIWPLSRLRGRSGLSLQPIIW